MNYSRPSHRVALFFGATLLLTISACSGAGSAAPSPTPAPVKQISVNAAPVKRADISNNLSYTGDVKSKASIMIVPKVTGRIEKLMVEIGSPVKIGNVIAELEKEQATLTVRQAEAGLASAKARSVILKAGARPEAVAQADANARAARARVASLEQSSRPEQVAQANANVEAARLRVAALKTPRSEAIAQAGANVQSAQARLVQLNNGATPEQIRAAEVGIEQAKNALYVVQTAKDAACSRGKSFTCESAMGQADAAEDGIKVAMQQLRIVKSPPTAEQVSQAQAAVDQAQQQLNLANNPASEQDIALAENGIKSAEAVLGLTKRPVLSSDIDGARASAEAAEAQARLVANPFTQQDLDAADSQVTLAQAQVELARTTLNELTVRSPVDGVVSERQLVVGSVASPSTPIVAITANETEIAINVEESQLGRIQSGQVAQIQVPAYPGESLAGKVTLIAPTIDARSRTATVKIVPLGDAAAKLKPGMFAQIIVESEKKPGALVVPRSAILPGNPAFVFAIIGGSVKRVEVVLGIQDRDQVEIIKGLSDGDQVVLDAVNLRDGDRVAVASIR